MKKPTFFKDRLKLRDWFRKNHKTKKELWVGYYKKHTKIPGIDWSESVDEAICFGWIDGIRKSIDEKSYKIRFIPRNPRSHWSKVNIEKAERLIKEKLMSPAGLELYNQRDEKRSKKASYEQKEVKLKKEYEQKIKANKKAWKYYQTMAPSARKTSIHWVMSAKREETKLRRLGIFIKSCEKNEKIPLMQIGKKKN
jgi:uncharacterized protein YdeI (YjbR/CyaY-like superfamily)